MTDDVTWFLEQWARWASQGRGLALGYPSMTPFRRLLGSTVKSCSLPDAVALEVDAAVSRLVRRDRRLGDALLLSYLAGRSAADIGRKMQCSRSTADRMVKIAEGYVSGYLDGGCEDEPAQVAV